jgi:hypothetical protein
LLDFEAVHRDISKMELTIIFSGLNNPISRKTLVEQEDRFDVLPALLEQ